MAITDTDKVDFLWKRDIFGTSKTAPGAAKTGSNETIASGAPVYAGDIWAQSDTIPAPPPGSATSTVDVLYAAARVHATTDPTAPANQTWLATTTPGDLTTLRGDFIQPIFDPDYAAQVFIGDPNTGPATRIFPDATNEEWVFDYAAGVLFFPNSIPANRPAGIGSGTVSVSGNGIYIQAYRYIGVKGLSGGVTGGTVDGGSF